jgi:PKD repeat protein
VPNAGGISGPYSSVTAAYSVWRAEPGNTNTSTLKQVLNDIGVAVGALTTPAGDTAENASSDATKGGEAANGQWSLVFGNTGGLLTRILKVVFGGILIISGVLHITGATDKVKAALGPAGMAVLAA